MVWWFFTVAYNLELFGGRFHNTPSLALGWGSVSLGGYYLQSLAVTPQILIISLIISYVAGRGRDLYEAAKPVCKDRNPSAKEENRFAWTLLKTHILFMNILAVAKLTWKLLAQS